MAEELNRTGQGWRWLELDCTQCGVRFYFSRSVPKPLPPPGEAALCEGCSEYARGEAAATAHMQERIDALEAELALAKSFHDVAVVQRDTERTRHDRLIRAATRHIQSEGYCHESPAYMDEDSDDPYCDRKHCTYCALGRAVDMI